MSHDNFTKDLIARLESRQNIPWKSVSRTLELTILQVYSTAKLPILSSPLSEIPSLGTLSASPKENLSLLAPAPWDDSQHQATSSASLFSTLSNLTTVHELVNELVHPVPALWEGTLPNSGTDSKAAPPTCNAGLVQATLGWALLAGTDISQPTCLLSWYGLYQLGKQTCWAGTETVPAWRVGQTALNLLAEHVGSLPAQQADWSAYRAGTVLYQFSTMKKQLSLDIKWHPANSSQLSTIYPDLFFS
jgi:hypothetical protein